MVGQTSLLFIGQVLPDEKMNSKISLFVLICLLNRKGFKGVVVKLKETIADSGTK